MVQINDRCCSRVCRAGIAIRLATLKHTDILVWLRTPNGGRTSTVSNTPSRLKCAAQHGLVVNHMRGKAHLPSDRVAPFSSQSRGMEAQLRIRQEAREKQDVLADLLRWQPEAPTRSTSSTAKPTRPAGPAVPGKQAGLAPLRGQRGGASSKSPAASHIRESVSSATKAQSGTAAKHTYDYFKDKWDKFDYDAALADDDDENVTIKHATAQKEAAEMQHQMKHSRYGTLTARTPCLKADACQALSVMPSAVCEFGDQSTTSVRCRTRNTPVSSKQKQQPLAPSEASDAELWKDRGNKAFTKGAYADAKKSYTQSIALEPTCLAYANRAMAELKLKDFTAAEADCTEAIQLDASYIKAYLRRASACKELGKLLEAAKDYEHALLLDPTSKATAADRRACLNLLYQQEQLQHELPRTPLTFSAQEVAASMQASSSQLDAQPADTSMQAAHPAAKAQQQISRHDAPDIKSANAPTLEQHPSAASQQQADKRDSQPAHAQRQPSQASQQPFGRRGAPSCVIEELPNEPDADSPHKPASSSAFPPPSAAASAQPSPKARSKQRAFSFDKPKTPNARQQAPTLPNGVQNDRAATDAVQSSPLTRTATSAEDAQPAGTSLGKKQAAPIGNSTTSTDRPASPPSQRLADACSQPNPLSAALPAAAKRQPAKQHNPSPPPQAAPSSTAASSSAPDIQTDATVKPEAPSPSTGRPVSDNAAAMPTPLPGSDTQTAMPPPALPTQQMENPLFMSDDEFSVSTSQSSAAKGPVGQPLETHGSNHGLEHMQNGHAAAANRSGTAASLAAASQPRSSDLPNGSLKAPMPLPRSGPPHKARAVSAQHVCNIGCFGISRFWLSVWRGVLNSDLLCAGLALPHTILYHVKTQYCVV